jgi:hypothetical protein
MVTDLIAGLGLGAHFSQESLMASRHLPEPAAKTALSAIGV